MDGHKADTTFTIARVLDASEPSSGEKRVLGGGHETRITAHAVKALEAPKAGNRVVWDSELTGFGVRITAAGSVSFVLRYVLDGRERRYTIGKFPDLSPSAARERATILRGRITEGYDPLESRKEAREAPTVDELCQDYLERHARPKKRQSSVKGDEHLIETYIKPKIGARKAASVGRRDLDEIHQSLSSHPYQANRVLALLSTMISLAVAWGWRSDNPTKGIKRFPEDRRNRWLNKNELGALSRALAAHKDKRFANAIRLLVLTGARRGEVLKSTWCQFDLQRGVWIKPSHHTKQKKTEHVPLSGAAIALLSELLSGAEEAAGGKGNVSKDAYLFPGDAEGKSLQQLKKSWKTVCDRTGLAGVRIHDLRHTFASHLVSGGHSLPLVGRLLGHTQAATTHRYAHLADDPLRQATEQFAVVYESSDRLQDATSQ